MSVEVSQNIEKNHSKYTDFRDALSDSHLDEDEKDKLTEKYYKECDEIHEETQDSCMQLQNEMSLYKEMTEMSRDEVKTLQTILGFTGNQRDGLRGPNTFANYMELSNKYDIFSGMSPKQVVGEFIKNIKSIFESLSQDERKELQRTVGTGDDGIYGSNTRGKILQNFENVREVFLRASIQVEGTGVANQDDEPAVLQQEEPSVVVSVPGNHHPDIFTPEVSIELLSQDEKIEKFIGEAELIPRVLIRFLQEGVSTGVDGSFGPNSARAVITKYPDAQSLEDVMRIEGIPMTSDGVLPTRENTPESQREVFREIYGEYVSVLEDNLDLPGGLIDAIIRQETKFGTYGGLMSPSGCKGMMQLSAVSISDMQMEHRGGTRYRTLFQNLDLDRLLNIDIGEGKSISETIPSPIIESLRTLKNPDTSNAVFSSEIRNLRSFIKDDNSYFNHAVNMILGSVYLAGTYHDDSRVHGGRGDVTATADLYNAAPGERVRYRNNVTNFFNEYNQE
ncbi:hypothetical protein LR010_02775 [Candidatus Gracilibacteria bacterium]|nr:hypothetical protein [Candidatus Gracilibacteria bacterium]